ncbi:unnamed protein product, partial [Mesorhabditis belari]|uniref:Uncharacterized protein n=1 Tax=Mesorhabditis belari TaxID=2138241 RepID=A0AAF3J7F4_9BILA
MNETTTISADYNADDHPDIPCANFSGYNYETKAGVRMTWDGLPLHGHLNDYINTWIAVTMFLEQNNPLKRRAAIRFSIMLITTHLTVIFYYLAKKLLTDSDALPLFCYLLLDLAPFLCYCIIAFFVIVFNLQPKEGTLQKITDVSTSTRNLT